MTIATILPNPNLLKLECLVSRPDRIEMRMKAQPESAKCPLCGFHASRIHSRYVRKLADLPWQGVTVWLEVHVRKFFCDRSACEQKIFTERLPGVTVPYARRTLRLTDVFELIGLMMGGEAGARAVRELRMATSPDTLLRAVRRIELEAVETPRLLGVDDFALRRGHTYGTILVDLEKRKVIDLLPDRTAETLKTWLEAHPGIEIITRDRAGAYAEGARAGAPAAIQIADQWHLFKNLGETLERFFNRHHRLLAEVTKPAPPLAEVKPGGEPARDPDLKAAAPRPLTRGAAEKARRRERRLERFQAVLALAHQGRGIREMARQTGLSRATIRKFVTADVFPEVRQRASRPGILTPFISSLKERWAAGCQNASQLWRELRERGFRGCAATVRRWAAHKLRPPGQPERKRKRQPTSRPEKLSPRQAMWLVICNPAKLNPTQLDIRAKLLTAHPDIKAAASLAQEFGRILRSRDPAGFSTWTESVRASDLPDFQQFLKGLEPDRAAVEATLHSKLTNGQTEGQVTRLKMIKRRGYGRAKFDLLRQQVLHAS